MVYVTSERCGGFALKRDEIVAKMRLKLTGTTLLRISSETEESNKRGSKRSTSGAPSSSRPIKKTKSGASKDGIDDVDADVPKSLPCADQAQHPPLQTRAKVSMR